MFLTSLLQTGLQDPNIFNGYLILGYVVLWVIGFGYVASLVIRQRNMQKDIDLMRQILQDDEDIT